MPCFTTLELEVECCKDITLSLGLEPLTLYTVDIGSAAGGGLNRRELATNAQGDLMLKKVNYPSGYFAARQILVTISIDGKRGVPIFYDGKAYDSVLLTLVRVNTAVG